MAVNGLMSQAQQGSLIVAPSVARELVQLAGANSCFLFDSFSFFFSAALVMTLTIDRQALRTEPSAVLDSMRQGFGFIFRHATISFVILAMTAGMFAMRCFGALLSIYVGDVLHSTSAVFGALNTLAARDQPAVDRCARGRRAGGARCHRFRNFLHPGFDDWAVLLASRANGKRLGGE